jgi:hypothetical protein
LIIDEVTHGVVGEYGIGESATCLRRRGDPTLFNEVLKWRRTVHRHEAGDGMTVLGDRHGVPLLDEVEMTA